LRGKVRRVRSACRLYEHKRTIEVQRGLLVERIPPELPGKGRIGLLRRRQMRQQEQRRDGRAHYGQGIVDVLLMT
jgi:hypothetical protein